MAVTAVSTTLDVTAAVGAVSPTTTYTQCKCGDAVAVKNDLVRKLVRTHGIKPRCRKCQAADRRELDAVNRDGNRCRVCNQQNELTVHNRNLASSDASDLITLCKSCKHMFELNTQWDAGTHTFAARPVTRFGELEI